MVPAAMTREHNRLSRRVERYAKVTAKMAGVGTRLAGEKILRKKPEPSAVAVRLREALGGLKGPLMKVAQMLSTIPDIVPPEYAAEFAQLQADAPPMGWLFVKRRMAAELGPDWEKKFKNFSREAYAAASLGQVHRAETLDGQPIVCKLQYPDMQSAVAADLRQLQLLMVIFERYDRAVSTQEVQKEIADRLYEELDYKREAKHIELYRTILQGAPGVDVPEVVGNLSTSRLLSMSQLEGERFSDAVKRGKRDRTMIAVHMFNAWYIPLYRYGIIHGDPHMGNYTVRRDNGINLLDFGCIRIFPPRLVAGVIRLYHALVNNDIDEAAAAYESWGFHKPSRALIETLNIWARFVYAPILEDRSRLIEETNSGFYGRETANKVHAELRKLGGGISIPREFVFMDRAAIGLGSVFLRLRAEVNWYRLFHGLVDDFNLQELTERQTELLQTLGLPVP